MKHSVGDIVRIKKGVGGLDPSGNLKLAQIYEISTSYYMMRYKMEGEWIVHPFYWKDSDFEMGVDHLGIEIGSVQLAQSVEDCLELREAISK